MNEKITFFKLIREIYQTAGIHPCEPNERGCFNFRNSFISVTLSIVFIVSTVFLLCDANTIDEYGSSFYISTTVFLDIFMWSTLIQKMGDLFNLMDQMNEFGQKSEPQISLTKWFFTSRYFMADVSTETSRNRQHCRKWVEIFDVNIRNVSTRLQWM